ncbi:hypothetical protein IJ670_05700, partial [bacterium]|nr:hypothetical protein [bacterium]
LFCLVALVAALRAKNTKINLLFIPSLLTIIAVFLFSYSNIMYFQTKYLMIVYPLIICCTAYGFTAFKNKSVGILMFSFLIFLNGMYTIFIPKNIYSYGAVEVSGNLNQVLNETIRITEDDLLLSTFISDKLKVAIDKGKMISFPFDEGLLLKNKKALEYYFGKEKLATLNRQNVKDELIDDVIKKVISPVLDKNLYEDYIKNMKEGQRLVVISPYEHITGQLEQPLNITKDNYKSYVTFEFLMTKATRDAIDVVQKYLTYAGRYRDTNRGYALYVFEK